MDSGCFKSGVLRALLATSPALMPLIRITKTWARRTSLNDARFGSLNSYSLGLLCIFHLQTLRAPQLPPLWRVLPGGGGGAPPPSHQRVMHGGARPPDGILDSVAAAAHEWAASAPVELINSDESDDQILDTLLHSLFVRIAAIALYRLSGEGEACALSTWAGGYAQTFNAQLRTASAAGGPPLAQESEPPTQLALLQQMVQTLHAQWPEGEAEAAQLPRALWHVCACAEATMLSSDESVILWETCRSLGAGFEEARESEWRRKQSRVGSAGTLGKSAVAAMRPSLTEAVEKVERAALLKQSEQAAKVKQQNQALAKAREAEKRAAAAVAKADSGAAASERTGAEQTSGSSADAQAAEVRSASEQASASRQAAGPELTRAQRRAQVAHRAAEDELILDFSESDEASKELASEHDAGSSAATEGTDRNAGSVSLRDAQDATTAGPALSASEPLTHVAAPQAREHGAGLDAMAEAARAVAQAALSVAGPAAAAAGGAASRHFPALLMQANRPTL